MKPQSRTRSGSKPPSIDSLSEADIQIQVVEYASLLAAQCGFLFFSVGNEAMGEAKTGAGLGRMARLKKMGLRPGVADLVFVKDGRAYFLEMKKPGGKQSDDQTDFQLDAARVGAQYAVAYSFEEAVKILQSWGIIPT
jgi:hypothetical protein